jgi:hypothetical protein
LKRFIKPSDLLAKCLSFFVGDLVFRIIGARRLFSGIEPFRTPRLGPAQGGMVAALLSEERSAPSCFLLPTSLNELGMNLAEASLKRNPLGSGQGGGSRFGDRSARCSRAQSPFLCVLLMWSALSRTGHRVLTRDTPSTRTVSLLWITMRGSLHSVAARSPAGVTEDFRQSHPSFSNSLDARRRRASLQESQARRNRLLAFTSCSPSARSRRRAKSNLASLLICKPAIHRNNRMNCASEALILCSFIPKVRYFPSGARLA